VYPKSIREASVKNITDDSSLINCLESAYDEGYELGHDDGETEAADAQAAEVEASWEAATKTFDAWFAHVYDEQTSPNVILDICEMLHKTCNSPYLVNKMFDELSFVFAKKIGFIG
jgi:flagellar biosynthesis/type III secretory pathway protein FliH